MKRRYTEKTHSGAKLFTWKFDGEDELGTVPNNGVGGYLITIGGDVRERETVTEIQEARAIPRKQAYTLEELRKIGINVETFID